MKSPFVVYKGFPRAARVFAQHPAETRPEVYDVSVKYLVGPHDPFARSQVAVLEQCVTCQALLKTFGRSFGSVENLRRAETNSIRWRDPVFPSVEDRIDIVEREYQR